jgi:DNA adenine methylase
MRKPKTIEEAKTNKENYYYWIRSLYNALTPLEKTSPLGSAYFIFLNKTCFRGVHRVGPRGYNVPYGNYANPEIADLAHMQKISSLITNVEFVFSDFSDVLKPEYFDRGDFVYLDPPYLPISQKSFVKYNNCGFDDAKHHQLFSMIDALPCKFMMSNSKTPESLKKYEVIDMVCRRSINSKNPSSTAKEVIVKNY